MATKRSRRKAEREIKNFAKKRPFVFFLIVVLIAVAVGVYYFWQKNKKDDDPHTDVYSVGGAFTQEDVAEIKDGDLSIHFLELGNEYTGDCTLIKVGKTEVLIDAGSRKNSAPTIKKYLDTYCTDGVLEYVIATHAHQDHIAGFIGSKSGSTKTGIFYQYKIGTLIQFARSDQKLETDAGKATLYAEYLEAVEYLKTKETTVYTALECWQGGDATEGARRKFILDSESQTSMNILYNYFYENPTSGGGGENEYSVCMLLTKGDDHYLFTGDLEAKGEEYLKANNFLPKVKLFKAGHHGSYTASSEALLSVIQPDIVCVCCCCGNMEYAKNPENDFPSQAFTNRVAKYTKQIYVTSIISADGEKGESMNGNIVLIEKDGETKVRCSNNATLFKDTDWFKVNRTWPLDGVQ